MCATVLNNIYSIIFTSTTTTTTTSTTAAAAKNYVFEFQNTTTACYSDCASNFEEMLKIFMGLYESHSCS